MNDITVEVAKIPFSTNHFNVNQKVFVVNKSGNMAFEVCGKFKGRGRYVTAWISWENKTKEPPKFKKINVDKDFAERHNLLNAK